MDKNKLKAGLTKAIADGAGKAKFEQSVEIAVNFNSVDFKKPENRLNAEVVMPFSPRPVKVAIFADGQVALEAKTIADAVFAAADIQVFTDKKKQKELLQYTILAQPIFMAQIGKALGQVLGAKGKLPRPLLPGSNLKEAVDRAKHTVVIKNKGKYLPTVHVIIGKEKMKQEELLENIVAVLESITKKIPESQITNVYIKTTMGPAVKV